MNSLLALVGVLSHTLVIPLAPLSINPRVRLPLLRHHEELVIVTVVLTLRGLRLLCGRRTRWRPGAACGIDQAVTIFRINEPGGDVDRHRSHRALSATAPVVHHCRHHRLLTSQRIRAVQPSGAWR